MPLTQEDIAFFHSGTHTKIYEVMGGRLTDNGAHFAVWAPHAEDVAVIGDFNNWVREEDSMTRANFGIWTCEIPGAKEGDRYQFAVLQKGGGWVNKTDPFGLHSETRPGTASILTKLEFSWTDQVWQESQKPFADDAPFNVYEVHLGSWKQKNGDFYNYREVAHELADYCKMMGYTHIELLPLSEHPLDESWGYQVTGYYSVTSRYGTPSDFQYFVDVMHSEGIGVIIDWVPGHFPVDESGLAHFDGTSLFEHEDPMLGFQPKWGTHVFDYDKPEVQAFLIGSALFWFDKMHVDAIRVDAVCSMFSRQFGREEWQPNIHGGHEYLEAIAFMKKLTNAVHDTFPNSVMIAEDTKGFPGITTPVAIGGIGFDMKWNLGWTHHTLIFLKAPYKKREEMHSEIIYPFTFAYQEKYMLILWHDDVANGKDSLFGKMPDDEFCNLRLLLGMKMTMPGKKLLFMGGEFGQREKWGCKEEAHFHLLDDPRHAAIQKYTADLNHFYRKTPALYEIDFDPSGMEWVAKEERGYFSYLRKGKKQTIHCLHNYLDHPVENVKTFPGKVFTSDAKEYGGCGMLPERIEKTRITLPPLSTTIIVIDE